MFSGGCHQAEESPRAQAKPEARENHERDRNRAALVEPLSSTANVPSSSLRNVQWCAETVGAPMQMSQSSARPTVYFSCSREKDSPRIWSERIKSFGIPISPCCLNRFSGSKVSVCANFNPLLYFCASKVEKISYAKRIFPKESGRWKFRTGTGCHAIQCGFASLSPHL